MNTGQNEPFYVVGISVRTTNENQQAAKDIPALWQRFMSENIVEQIPNKLSNEVYAVYTDYESDYTKPYTTIIGCKVSEISNIPEGFVCKKIAAPNYKTYAAKGSLTENIVYNKWLEIWSEDINRAYTSDYEVYGAKASDPTNAEVEIFIGVN
ncbi:effector binding domain-containing protein [Tenacibaculum mesophilum]|uniref:GyrI-like domain-containing protein n=1 Tax=Tenacibaculum mesophilum TaxID=104268 RepID=UPI00142F983C|nr:effector binding domain-containing protein [Tenacibaculum mesophilum]KAF9660349.1 effector binding domain-containing protein [Tenacibaculum mesophilum]